MTTDAYRQARAALAAQRPTPQPAEVGDSPLSPGHQAEQPDRTPARRRPRSVTDEAAPEQQQARAWIRIAERHVRLRHRTGDRCDCEQLYATVVPGQVLAETSPDPQREEPDR